MRAAFNRLRWQLTLSHLVAIAVTLVALVAVLVLVTVIIWQGANEPSREPAQAARLVANSAEGLIIRRAPPAELNVVLRALVNGDLRPPIGGQVLPDAGRRFEQFGPSLRDLAYLVVLAPDGRLLGSSDPAGTAFAPAEQGLWTGLREAALAGERDPRRLTLLRPGQVPAVLGAAPVMDASGRPAAVVVAVASTLAPAASPWTVGRTLIVFWAASLTVLAAASGFALLAASLVAYLLASRLAARLERLGQAAEAFAEGDLSRRVEPGPEDEVGQLGRRLNRMADQLAATIAAQEAQRQRAEGALQSRRELVANVSHELRTPLASIRGHLESILMRQPAIDERGRADLAIIHREAERLGGLVADLFALSTAEAGPVALQPAPLDLGHLLSEVAEGIGPIARREGKVTLLATSPPGLAPVLADRARLIQVLENLVRNALRHTPEGGLIALRAEALEEMARVVVEDTGVGIVPEALPHVFERFYRGDTARDRSSGGAGLGLAIVRELVEAMGGSVAVESVVGQGSRFLFTLPYARPGGS